MGVFGGIISILDWLKEKVPIQSRRERWLNELDNLKKERKELLKGKCDDKKTARVLFIDSRIDYLVQLIRNSEIKG